MKYLLVVLPVLSFMGLSLVACDQNSNDVTGENSSTEKAQLQEGMAPNGKVFEYGIYTAQRKGRERGDLSTNTGKVITKPVLELSEQTDRIPLVKGTYFAYRYRIMDLPKEIARKPAVELRKVLVHPVMTLPDGTTATGWDRATRARVSVGQVIAFDGYAFNEDYELVEGEWSFQIWLGEQQLVEQKFTTYWPGDESGNESGNNSGEKSGDAQKTDQGSDDKGPAKEPADVNPV
jgi:hypothetical protein